MFAVNRFLILLSVLLTTSISAQDVKITYLANEGVLIESDDKKVMVDALFDDHYKAYMSPSPELVARMNNKQNPFEQVDLVLTTHIHRDHYEAKITGDFLSAHEESKFISSAQVRDDLEEKYISYADIKPRVIAHNRDTYTTREVINGITVHSFFINHSGGFRAANIENMGFIVELGGKKILHLGDSDMDVERFRAVNLSQYNVDVALIPYWYMVDEKGQEIIRNHIKPGNLIGVHYPKVGSPTALEEINSSFPKAIVFKTALESRQY